MDSKGTVSTEASDNDTESAGLSEIGMKVAEALDDVGGSELNGELG